MFQQIIKRTTKTTNFCQFLVVSFIRVNNFLSKNMVILKNLCYTKKDSN